MESLRSMWHNFAALCTANFVHTFLGFIRHRYTLVLLRDLKSRFRSNSMLLLRLIMLLRLTEEPTNERTNEPSPLDVFLSEAIPLFPFACKFRTQSVAGKEEEEDTPWRRKTYRRFNVKSVLFNYGSSGKVLLTCPCAGLVLRFSYPAHLSSVRTS